MIQVGKSVGCVTIFIFILKILLLIGMSIIVTHIKSTHGIIEDEIIYKNLSLGLKSHTR